MAHIKKIQLFYFSPSGTTKKIVEQIADNFEGEKVKFDLIKTPIKCEIICDGDTLAIVAVPVFMGRVPTVCAEMFGMLKGGNTPVIAVVVYGNRAYEDALLELTDILSANNFDVVGAGAFVARHSLYPQYTEARPDILDKQKIDEFAVKCKEKLAKSELSETPLKVSGNKPYRQIGEIPLFPKANKKCTKCGICANICPKHAISKDAPQKTDKSLCIACTACVYGCPHKARKFSGAKYIIAGEMLKSKLKIRRDAEYFL